MATPAQRRRAKEASGGPVAEFARVLVPGENDKAREFTEFMKEAAPSLTRLALALCGDRLRAEELVQQTFVRTYESWDRIVEGSSYAYARRVLANLRIDTWRRLRRERLVDPSELPEVAEQDRSEAVVVRDHLLSALATISTRRRRIVVLRYIEGMSETEVAEILDLPRGTVKSASSRALTDLRRALTSSGEVS